MCEKFKLNDAGEQARGASLVKAVGKEGHP